MWNKLDTVSMAPHHSCCHPNSCSHIFCLDYPLMIQDGHEAFLWICVDSLSTVNSESDLELLGCVLCCALLDVIDWLDSGVILGILFWLWGNLNRWWWYAAKWSNVKHWFPVCFIPVSSGTLRNNLDIVGVDRSIKLGTFCQNSIWRPVYAFSISALDITYSITSSGMPFHRRFMSFLINPYSRAIYFQ